MSDVQVDDHGYEGWLLSEPFHDPWTVREVVFWVEGGVTDEAVLEEEAEKYLRRHRPQMEVARVFEDIEADEHGPPERVLRVFIE